MADEQKNVCKHCKETIIKGAKKCPHCQSDLRSYFLKHPVLLLFIAAIFIPIIITSFNDKNNSSAPTNTPASQQPKEIIDTSNIKYEVIKTWDIPNGGTGKEILIPVSYLNEKDMVALGEKLKTDYADERNNFIWVFTDRKMSSLRAKLMKDKLNKSDQTFYDAHYVGQYNKNINSGMNTFTIYFDGVSGSNQKTINY